MKALLINGSPHEHGCTYTALRELADTLEEDDDTITNRLDTMAKENQISTVICNREGKIYYRNYSFDSILKDMTWLDLRSVYQQTLRKGGTYVQQYERPSQVVGFLFSTYPTKDSTLMPGLDRVEVDPIREDGGKGMLYAMVVPLKNGNDRLLLVNCSLTPVSATVETLKVELKHPQQNEDDCSEQRKAAENPPANAQLAGGMGSMPGFAGGILLRAKGKILVFFRPQSDSQPLSV